MNRDDVQYYLFDCLRNYKAQIQSGVHYIILAWIDLILSMPTRRHIPMRTKAHQQQKGFQANSRTTTAVSQQAPTEQ
jgi:hypothetical protein